MSDDLLYLSLDDIRATIERIKGMVSDDEAAHAAEDRLHQRVLGAISMGQCEAPNEAAKLALTTMDIDFARWCA